MEARNWIAIAALVPAFVISSFGFIQWRSGRDGNRAAAIRARFELAESAVDPVLRRAFRADAERRMLASIRVPAKGWHRRIGLAVSGIPMLLLAFFITFVPGMFQNVQEEEAFLVELVVLILRVVAAVAAAPLFVLFLRLLLREPVTVARLSNIEEQLDVDARKVEVRW